MRNLNKEKLIDELAKKTGFTKVDLRKVLDALLDIVTNELRDGGSVKIVGFGQFHTRTAKPRVGRNINKGENCEIPERIIPVFTPGEVLKRACDR